MKNKIKWMLVEEKKTDKMIAHMYVGEYKGYVVQFELYFINNKLNENDANDLIVEEYYFIDHDEREFRKEEELIAALDEKE